MIKNQFGRRNLIPFIRAELAFKLAGLFQKKAQENLEQGRKNGAAVINSRYENDRSCQNSDKSDSLNIEKFDSIEDLEKETPTTQLTPYTRAEKALELETEKQVKAQDTMVTPQKTFVPSQPVKVVKST
jgi:hypothetical protein